jgi:carbonic anhydrase/acetyltransferase-like protein (isoleucine patch superfamily)
MIVSYQGKTPNIASASFIAPNAVLIGDLEIAEDVSIWFGAVLRGDYGKIKIGRGSNVQDNAMIHAPLDGETVIGDEVTIGHGAVLEGCTVGPRTVIGANAVVTFGAMVGERCMVAAGAVISEGMTIPPGTLVAGVPAEVKKELSGSSLQWVEEAGAHYLKLARKYLDENWD